MIANLIFDTDPALQATWVTEAVRRKDEVQKGATTPISGEEAFAQVRQLLE
jgi:hypothetical protein